MGDLQKGLQPKVVIQEDFEQRKQKARDNRKAKLMANPNQLRQDFWRNERSDFDVLKRELIDQKAQILDIKRVQRDTVN